MQLERLQDPFTQIRSQISTTIAVDIDDLPYYYDTTMILYMHCNCFVDENAGLRPKQHRIKPVALSYAY